MWLRDDCSFMAVAPTDRCRIARSNSCTLASRVLRASYTLQLAFCWLRSGLMSRCAPKAGSQPCRSGRVTCFAQYACGQIVMISLKAGLQHE